MKHFYKVETALWALLFLLSNTVSYLLILTQDYYLDLKSHLLYIN